MENDNNKYTEDNYQMSITTSAPSLIFALKKHINWKCYHFGRNKKITDTKRNSKAATLTATALNKSSSCNRITASFKYIKNGTK